MRHIAIVGSRQAGLQVGFGLLKHGYQVTLYSDRTAEQWLNNSRPNGTAFLFDQAMQNERDLGLNLTEEEASYGEGIQLTFLQEVGEIVLTMQGPLDKPGQAVDQRLKFSGWLGEFEKRGGNLIHKMVVSGDLEASAATYGLVIIAVGKGDITHQLFERDAVRSIYDTPQRHLALITVTKTKPWRDIPFHPIKFTFISPVGEMFWMPFFDKSGASAYSIVFEARPGGPMDRFVGQVKTGEETGEIAKAVIRDLAPWDYEHVKDAVLTDELAWLTGKFPPTVRNPVGKLPSGKVVMALGDTAITYDPIVAQGANSASRMASVVLRAIVEREEEAYDAEWVNAVFKTYWESEAQYAYMFTSAILEPITAAAACVLAAGAKSTSIAGEFFSHFNNPRGYWSWVVDQVEAERWVAERTAS